MYPVTKQSSRRLRQSMKFDEKHQHEFANKARVRGGELNTYLFRNGLKRGWYSRDPDLF